MIIDIMGLLGGGKTLLQTILGYRGHTKGLNVYSNYKTTFSEIINPIEFLKFEDGLENCIILLDEAETIFDSRVNKRANRLGTYFVLQTRKRKVHLIYTSQIKGAVDLRIRDMATIEILAERHKRYFEYTVIFGNRVKSFKLSEIKAEPFYDMFDTTEIILPVELMSKELISFEELSELAKTLPTKKSFVVVARKMLPFVSGEDVSGAYDLIKVDRIKEAKLVLNY